MGRKICVELDEPGGLSYFRSVAAAAQALRTSEAAIKHAIANGGFVSGTRVRARSVPWKRLQKDRRFFTICYAVPWNYRCGLDKLAEEMGLTMTGLIRHCVISTFTEEEIWFKAAQTEGFIQEKFHPLPQGKQRVWLISDKRKTKKWEPRYKPAPLDASTGSYVGYRDKNWRDRMHLLSAQEIRLRRRLEAIQTQINKARKKAKKLGVEDETRVRRRNRRTSAQTVRNRLSRDKGHDAGGPGRKEDV